MSNTISSRRMRANVSSAAMSNDPKISSAGSAISVPRTATPAPRNPSVGTRLHERSLNISCGNPATVCAPVTIAPAPIFASPASWIRTPRASSAISGRKSISSRMSSTTSTCDSRQTIPAAASSAQTTGNQETGRTFFAQTRAATQNKAVQRNTFSPHGTLRSSASPVMPRISAAIPMTTAVRWWSMPFASTLCIAK